MQLEIFTCNDGEAKETMMDISVVVPVYGCREAVRPLCERLVKTLDQIVESFEIILVDDHCPQNSWEDIEKECVVDQRIVGIQLSRNFGQIRAITAGLDYSSGDWVVVMDCDLQDRPEAIKDLYAKAHEGYDVVFVKRTSSKENRITKALSRAFYRVYNYFTDGNYDGTLSNFSIASRQVISGYLEMREQARAYTLFLKWLGFKQAVIELDREVRAAGHSSYGFRRKCSMALELITAQSNKPLQMSIKLGFLFSFLAFIYLLFLVVQFFLRGNLLPGWTSIVASIYFVGGLLLVTIGIVGIYVGNIFNETKHRPLYLVRTVKNKERV